MADTNSAVSSGASTQPSKAAEQARIRKERREAKILKGGSARLDKITGLGGGIKRDSPPRTVSAHADPEEVDISEHYYAPPTTSRPQTTGSAPAAGGINEDALRQMMLGFDPSAANPSTNPFGGFPGMGPGGPGRMPGMDGAPGEDPMMKMIQELLGGVPGEGPGGMPSFPGMSNQSEPAVAGDPYAYVWRIVHAIFALALGLYIAFTTTHTGTKIERERSGFNYNIEGEVASASSSSLQFFWIFATMEVLLQTSRFWLEKGKTQQVGILGMVIKFLPQPFKGYLEIVARYFRIWTTVSGDAMVCVFVIGVTFWLRGGNAA